MKVTLINPPRVSENMATLRDEICFQDVIYTPFPLRLAQLAGVIRLQIPGVKIGIIDANALKMSLTELEEKIESPDLMIFQTAPGIIKEDYRVAQLVKKKSPSCVTVMIETGIAPLFPERILADFPAIDILIQGQPEKVVPDILRSLDDLGNVKGISYRSGEVVKNNGAADIMTDLDSLPFMAYDLLPMEKYSISFMDAPLHEKVLPGVRLRTTRDCPYGCPFCIIGSTDLRGYDRKWKKMSVGRVVDEIEYLVNEWGIYGIFFWDETYTLDRQRAYDISAEIIRRGIRIRWRCLTRIDCVDKELLEIMYKSGCRQIEYGLEAGDPDVRKKLHKNFPNEQAVSVIKQTRKAGIRANVDMIIGMPWETKESLKKTLCLAKQLNADNLHLTMAFPYPCTAYYEIAEKGGLLEFDDIYNLMIHQRVRIGAKSFVKTFELSSSDLEAGWNSVRSSINKYYILRKTFCEPLSFVKLFMSCASGGEFVALFSKGIRRFFRTIFKTK